MSVEGQALGVPQLDRLLAPVPRGCLLALVNDPGVEPQPFLYQAAAENLERGDVVFATFNRPPSRVLQGIRELGFDRASPHRLVFLDAHSALVPGGEPAAFRLAEPGSPQAFADALGQASAAHPDAALVVDALTTLVDQASMPRFLAAWPSVSKALRRFRLAAVALTRWPYDGGLDPLERLFDAVVRLRGIEEPTRFGRTFTVEGAPWARRQGGPVPYTVAKPGGVLALVPKVLVTGPQGAGKSAFIASASDRHASADRMGTTVALDHGHVEEGGFAADLFGTPGHSRFDPMLRALARRAVGVILLVDSADPGSFPRAREMLEATWHEGVPLLVAASHQDAPGAMPPDAVARMLRLPSAAPAVGCVATRRDSARHVLRALLESVLGVEA